MLVSSMSVDRAVANDDKFPKNSQKKAWESDQPASDSPASRVLYSSP